MCVQRTVIHKHVDFCCKHITKTHIALEQQKCHACFATKDWKRNRKRGRGEGERKRSVFAVNFWELNGIFKFVCTCTHYRSCVSLVFNVHRVALHWVSAVDSVWPVFFPTFLAPFAHFFRNHDLISLFFNFSWFFSRHGFKIELCRIFEAFRYISTNLIVVHLMRSTSFVLLVVLLCRSLFKTITITKLPYSTRVWCIWCGMCVASNRVLLSLSPPRYGCWCGCLEQNEEKM